MSADADRERLRELIKEARDLAMKMMESDEWNDDFHAKMGCVAIDLIKVQRELR